MNHANESSTAENYESISNDLERRLKQLMSVFVIKRRFMPRHWFVFVALILAETYFCMKIAILLSKCTV